MKIRKENERLYSIEFADDELRNIADASRACGESVEDCLAAFFSGCLFRFNNCLDRKDGAYELD